MTDEPVDNEVVGTKVYDIPPSEAEPFELDGEPEEPSIEDQLKAINMPSEVITGFVILLDQDGQWVANSNLEMAQHVIKKREAVHTDFAFGSQAIASNVITTLGVQATVQAVLQNVGQVVVQAQLQAAQQLAQQEEGRKTWEQVQREQVAKGGRPIPGVGLGMPNGFSGRK